MTRFIELSGKRGKGKYAIVDDDDYGWLCQYRWHYSCGYARASKIINNIKTPRMHRLIMGEMNSNLVVDHINGDTLDNRKDNLRICTQSQNSKNAKVQQNRTSKYKGVTWSKSNDSWLVRVITDKNRINIGNFTNEIAAANAYNYYAIMYHGEFARLNDVEYMNDWGSYIMLKYTTSQYRGVSYNSREKVWISKITKDGITYNAGRFKSEVEAAHAYDKKAIELFGLDFPRLNFNN